MTKANERAQRTRTLLQGALLDLLSEQGYETITIQQIVQRARVGRTTFYLHFESKEALFMSCHEAVVSQLHLHPFYPRSRDEWLAHEAPPGLVTACQHLAEARPLLFRLFRSRESLLILRRLRDWSAQKLVASLSRAFPGVTPAIPMETLATYLASSQFALLQWWLEQRRRPSPDDLAQTLHRLQRAAICDTFSIVPGSVEERRS
jgi:AcrR family transcriptional regulator